jgi:hypothetical protein
MKETPISFNTKMVLSIAIGSKTQTRRPIKEKSVYAECPYGEIGDFLWVREDFLILPVNKIGKNVVHRINPANPSEAVIYRAGFKNADALKWEQSKQMPRWASRQLLKITEVKATQLHLMTQSDALAEGIDFVSSRSAVADFAELWESIYGHGSFNNNQPVWVIEFKLASD